MKRVISAVTALAAVFSFTVVAGSSNVHAAPSCPSSMTFTVEGTGHAPVPFKPAGASYNVPYAASTAPVGSVSGDRSIREGEANLSRAVTSFRNDCPDTPITIAGLSLGAVVVSNVCDDIDGYRVTCVTYGNPKRQGGGIMGNIPSVVPGLTHDGFRQAPANGPAIQEICNPRDLYCNGGNPLADPGHFIDSAIGTYLQGQHAYPAPVLAPVVPSTPTGIPVIPYVAEPVTSWVHPQAAIGEVYSARPLSEQVPEAWVPLLPREINEWVPPALPPLPRIPGL